jgi:hypothetical protein
MPGGFHVSFVPDDRSRLFHPRIRINTMVLAENDSLFIKYAIPKA